MRNGRKKLLRRLRKATMSCLRALKKMSHEKYVAPWQSMLVCVVPRGALVARPLSVLADSREALEACLL